MAGIEIHDLRKSYTVDGRHLSVLNGIHLSLREDAITVVLGRSGCGKTTLLRLIAGLEQPDSGTIRFDSTPKTAFVFQEPRLMPWLNVRDNIQFSLSRRDISAEETQWILETVGLAGFERAFPNQLSGGMQQRTALARALIYHPSFIMMDEPFAALDHFTREDMQQALLEIRRKTRASILFVTHSIDEALTLADSIVLISGGIISAEYAVDASHPRQLLTDEMISLKRRIVAGLETAS